MTLAIDQQGPCRPTQIVTFKQMLLAVQFEGAYSSLVQAESVAVTVLAAFGRQLKVTESEKLTSRLPVEAAVLLRSERPAVVPLTGREFVSDLASRTGATVANSRWDAGTVLRIVARLVGEDFISRILDQLPPGYALLCGRAELKVA